MITGIQRLARKASAIAGRNSRLVRSLRPAFELGLYALTGGRGVEQTINGFETFRIDPRHRVRFPEAYEPDVCAFLRSSVRSGAIVLDVGANIGIYALCLARWAGPAGHVYAFEPNPPARAILERHTNWNGYGARITVVGAAVADREGDAPIFAAGADGMSRLLASNPLLPDARQISVPLTTIDAFCATRSIAPDWLFIDIEGFEAAALEGARETIKARRRDLGIVVEMHPLAWDSSGWPRARLERLLEELELSPRPLQRQRDPLGEYGHIVMEPR